jgi:hypothetical protein
MFHKRVEAWLVFTPLSADGANKLMAVTGAGPPPMTVKPRMRCWRNGGDEFQHVGLLANGV